MVPDRGSGGNDYCGVVVVLVVVVVVVVVGVLLPWWVGREWRQLWRCGAAGGSACESNAHDGDRGVFVDDAGDGSDGEIGDGEDGGEPDCEGESEVGNVKSSRR